MESGKGINSRIVYIVGIAFLSIVLIAGIFFGYFVLKMESVPDVESILGTIPEFVVKDAKVEGIYGNIDSPSLIFCYNFPSDLPAKDIERAIVESASQEQWRIQSRDTSSIHFTRVGMPGKENVSVEEARVAICENSSTVYVGWMLGYSKNENPRIEETVAGKWAAEVLWPKLEALTIENKRSALALDGNPGK